MKNGYYMLMNVLYEAITEELQIHFQNTEITSGYM